MKNYCIHWTVFVAALIAMALILESSLSTQVANANQSYAAQTGETDATASESEVTETASASKSGTAQASAPKSGTTQASADQRKDLSKYDSIGTIYIGDSRWQAMDDICQIEDEDEGVFVVAKVGQGYSWMKNSALPEVKKIQRQHTEYDAWVLISDFGINDLMNISDYLATYRTLQAVDNQEVILVSVNPVGDNAAAITNQKVERFNRKLKTAGCYYIDTYSVVDDEGFYTKDGLHYDNDTYRLIYKTIQEKL